MKSKITLLAGLIIFFHVYWLFKLHAQDINDMGSLPEQVDLVTGTPIINIPLWTVKDMDIAVPISLSYNATGIKTAQPASWVGLGWNLNVGGSITRSVRSLPDDAHPLNNMYNDDEYYGWLFEDNNGWSTSENVENFDITSAEEVRSLYYETRFANGDMVGRDMEPDIYYFNVGGLSGSFVFDHGSSSINRQIKLTPHQNLQISYTLNEDTNELSSFTIIDTKGYTYTFEQREIVYSFTRNNLLADVEEVPSWYYNIYPTFEYPLTQSQLNNMFKNPKNILLYFRGLIKLSTLRGREYLNEESFSTYTSTWFLSSVVSPNGNNLTLNYVRETILLDDYPSESYRDYENPDPENEALQIEDMIANYNTLTKQSRIESQRLNSIESKEFVVEFKVADNEREDIHTDDPYPAKALEQIVVKKKTGTETDVLRVFDFYQHYYDSGSNLYVYNDEVSAEKRLILDSIVESCGDISLQPYKFNYIDNGLPSRYTTETDVWGFYKQTGTIETVPKIWVYPALTGSARFRLYPIPGVDADYILPGIDRTPDTYFYYSGTLQEIVLPGGGIIKYEYEPHTYRYGGKEYEGIGIRLKKLTLKDGDGTSSNDIVTEYTYNEGEVTSGRLLQMPVYGHFDPTFELSYWNEEFDYYNWSYVRYGYDIADYSEGTIMYKKVHVLRGNQGKTEYYFNTPFTYEDMTGDYEDLITLTLWHKYLDDYLPGGPEPIIDDLHFDYHSYPYPPNVNYSWNRGQLISQIEYGYENNDWFKTESLYNQYEIYYHNGNEPDIVYGIKSGFLTNNYYSQYDISQPLAVYGKYPVWTGINSLIDKSTHVIYKKDNPLDSIYSESYYSYNDLGMLRETKVDNGEKIKLSRIKYSGDYDIGNPASPDEMTDALIKFQEKNMIDIPVETLNLLESGSDYFVVNGSLILYKNFGTEAQPMILPEKVLNLDLMEPVDLSLFNISSVDNNDFLYDNDHKLKVINNNYDSRGNLVEYYKQNGLTYSTIYNLSNIPVAKISNATFGEFCYEGYEFEDENTTYNWFNDNYPNNQTISSEVKHTGDGSLNILSHQYGYASKSFSPVQINTQERYVFSAWAFTDNIDSEFKIYLQITRTNNYPAYVTANYDIQHIGEWQLLIVEANLSDYSDIEFVIPIICNTGQQSLPGYFDDIRFYPADALMTTKNYNKLNWKTSSMGPNEIPRFIEYDDLGRPVLTRDHEGNILSEIIYHNNN